MMIIKIPGIVSFPEKSMGMSNPGFCIVVLFISGH